MTTENPILHESDSAGTQKTVLHHKVSRVCLACHAEVLGVPVTPRDCLGFAKCETCTKVPIVEDGSDTPE
jgi:hypothetical protein